MKKLITGLMLAIFALGAQAQFIPGQVLTAAQLNAQFALYMPIAGGTLTGPLTVPTLITANAQISGGSISGISPPIPIASGGTSANTALGATSNFQYNEGATGAVNRSVASKLGDNPSSADFGTVGNGSTDDAPQFQKAYTALAGSTLRIPYTGNCYYLGSNVSQSTPPISLIVDPGVTFCGTGQLPPSTGHGGATVIGNYFYNAPTGGTSGRDSLNLSAELDPQAGFIGNGVAFFAAAYSPAGNPNFTGHLWSINTQTTLNPSTGSYNAQGIEVDVNNHYQTQTGVGVLFSGLGEYSPQAAIEIARANTTSDWNNGIWMRNFVTGILIDGSTSAAPTSGLSISGLSQNHVVLTPSSGAAGGNPIFTVKCAGGASNCAVISANGNISGGSASLSGNATVTASNAAIIANDSSGSSQASFYLQNKGTNVWKFANASSTNQLCLSRYVSGTNTDSPWCVSNSTGAISIIDGLSVTGTVSGTGFSNYLAAPPAIGSTTANSGAFTTITASSTITPSTTAGIVGTTLADNANAGSIGEYATAVGTNVSISNGVSTNITSVSLTAGDWDVSGNAVFSAAAGVTTNNMSASVGTTSATLNADPDRAIENGVTMNTGSTVSQLAPVQRINISATTTVYLVVNSIFTGGTTTVTGRIRARRIR